MAPIRPINAIKFNCDTFLSIRSRPPDGSVAAPLELLPSATIQRANFAMNVYALHMALAHGTKLKR